MADKLTDKFQATRLYRDTWEALQNPDIRIVVHQGGSRSSKTVSIMQVFLSLAESGIIPPFRLNIARKFRSNITDTILRDFDSETRRLDVEFAPQFLLSRNDQRYFINDCEFNFLGLDDKQKAHGMASDFAWLNEGIEIGKDEFDQIEMRTKQKIVIDFNPSSYDSWIYDLEKRSDVLFIRSTQLDNPFLEHWIREKILGYEPTAENVLRGTANKYMWDVYGLGIKAKLEGLVYENWEPVDEIPKDANFIADGLDFGFTNDPTAFVEMFEFDQAIYLNELIYEHRLNNQMIAQKFELFNVKPYDPIFADSSEPKSIDELHRAGFNVQGVVKGADSINFGIDILQGYKVYYTRRSINIDTEVRKYIWATDKNGKPLNVPIDEFNHAMDAIRYAAMMKLKRNTGVKTYTASEIGL